MSPPVAWATVKASAFLAGARRGLRAVATSNGKEIVPPFNVVITGSTKGELSFASALSYAVTLVQARCTSDIQVWGKLLPPILCELAIT